MIKGFSEGDDMNRNEKGCWYDQQPLKSMFVAIAFFVFVAVTFFVLCVFLFVRFSTARSSTEKAA